MRDIKYIIKRIIIGTGIALAVMFMKQNVLAYEWTVEGDDPIDLTGYSINLRTYINGSYSYYNPRYPVQTSPSDFTTYYTTSASSGNIQGSVYVGSNPDGRSVGPGIITGYVLNMGTYTFESGKNYSLVLPFGYGSSIYTSLDANVNNDKIIDPTTYSTNQPDIVTIDSVGFSFGGTNELNDTDVNIDSMYYFRVYFHVSEDVSNVSFYFGSHDYVYIVYTAFNTIGSTNYLLKTNFNCSSWGSNQSCYYESRRSYKPFLYTRVEGNYLPDPDVGVADITSDIKDEIDNIVDGVFGDDSDFPSMNGGGMHFGDNEYSLQDLLLMPLNFLQKLTTTDTCQPLTVPVPGLSANMSLPCISTFMTSIIGQQLVDLIKLIVGCILGFKIIVALYNSILHILSPDHLLYVDDIF